jgi:FAD/FMN-containing dehydrogenase
MKEQDNGLSAEQLAKLRRMFHRPILTSNDEEYTATRQIWNGQFDRRPSVIVQPISIAEVMQSVRFARDEGLAATVRGGGHSVSGKSVADGVMMIDLSLMKEVQIDPSRRTALVQGGTTWGELDRQSERFGLATTGGVISSTGVCGLTLGGGLGWLMGKHGLSCDNVVSADLVNAEGNHLTVSAIEKHDLFWAIRGGGGNFGIVTALELRLHDLTKVHGGVLLYPRPLAVDLLRQYRDLTQTAPDELTAYAALLVGHGHAMAAIALCHSGDGGAAACGQFHLSTPPAADMTGEKKYTEVQAMLDFTAPKGQHYYFKTRFLRELSDEAIRAMVDYAETLPTEQTQVIIEHMHGAASRVGVAQTAFGLRRVHYSINVIPAWTDPAMTEKCLAWAQGFGSLLSELGASDAYVNYLSEEGSPAVKASYGTNYAQLAALKKKYDPDNFFRFNQNIVPAD